MSYTDALNFPAATAYQLQHCHCRSMDKVCYYVTGRDQKMEDFKHLFDNAEDIDNSQQKDYDDEYL